MLQGNNSMSGFSPFDNPTGIPQDFPTYPPANFPDPLATDPDSPLETSVQQKIMELIQVFNYSLS
jgi:hypothetical protein